MIEINETNFETIVLQNEQLVLVDFAASWCGPCKIMTPILNEITEEYKDKMIIASVDVDTNQAIAAKYGVRNIPTFLFFKNGENIGKHVGAIVKSQLIEKINSYLK
jgi:thioredoxin 1